MTQTLVTSRGAVEVAGATAEGDGLWVPTADLERSTGWLLKAEGACKGEVCVPIPPRREQEFVRPGMFNFSALARHLGEPVVRELRRNAWAVGEPAETRNEALRSLEAPDFTLPDLDGTPHTLSNYRGRKVLLVSWASW